MENYTTNECEKLANDETLPLYPIGMPSIYRVRKDEDGIDESNPKSFSYIQDSTRILRYRFNREGEQVLYTSTTPNVAVGETLENFNGNFYIGKWRNNNPESNFNSFVALDENCSKDLKSNSRKIREEIKTHFSKAELERIDCLRNILEKDYSKVPKADKYKESSILASKILEVADCILSYSAKNDKELNVTFNKKSTDELLVLECVYYCGPLKDKMSLAYDVKKIGLVENGKIVWYKWEVNMESLKWLDDNQEGVDPAQYLAINKYARFHKYVNLNNDLCSLHIGYIQSQTDINWVNYEIQLILDNEKYN